MAKYETTADGTCAFVPVGELQALEAQVATIPASNAVNRQLADAVLALTPDAQRWRGVRLLLCEQDEAMRARMFEALEAYGDTVPELDTEPKGMALERLDEIIDGAILVAAGARNADG
jgi:hypothetical protein